MEKLLLSLLLEIKEAKLVLELVKQKKYLRQLKRQQMMQKKTWLKSH